MTEEQQPSYLEKQVWPFGGGVLTTGLAVVPHEDATLGVLIVRARPDGEYETADDAFNRSGELGGPELMLTFDSVDSIDRLIDSLTLLKDMMETDNDRA